MVELPARKKRGGGIGIAKTVVEVRTLVGPVAIKPHGTTVESRGVEGEFLHEGGPLKIRDNTHSAVEGS